MTYTVTPQEHQAGAIETGKLGNIAQAIDAQGFAVVEGLISTESQKLLMDSVLEDAASVRADGELTPHEQITGKGHLQLGLRRFAPYVCRDLLANPLIEHIVSAVLGEGAWLGFYNGNVNVPGSVSQPLHFDRPYSWKTPEEAEENGQRWPPATTTLSCSIALSDIVEANGATEIYPGSQYETAVAQWKLGDRLSDHAELIERWAPPARMEIPAGGICFRDPRMWHRGMPNPSDKTRPMIALTYHSGLAKHWRGTLVKDMSTEDRKRCEQDNSLRVMDDGSLGDGRLVFEANTAEVLAGEPSPHGIDRNVRFVDEEQHVDHLHDAHLLGGARVVDSRRESTTA